MAAIHPAFVLRCIAKVICASATAQEQVAAVGQVECGASPAGCRANSPPAHTAVWAWRGFQINRLVARPGAVGGLGDIELQPSRSVKTLER